MNIIPWFFWILFSLQLHLLDHLKLRKISKILILWSANYLSGKISKLNNSVWRKKIIDWNIKSYMEKYKEIIVGGTGTCFESLKKCMYYIRVFLVLKSVLIQMSLESSIHLNLDIYSSFDESRSLIHINLFWQKKCMYYII